jgi:hypothetical protein
MLRRGECDYALGRIGNPEVIAAPISGPSAEILQGVNRSTQMEFTFAR